MRCGNIHGRTSFAILRDASMKRNGQSEFTYTLLSLYLSGEFVKFKVSVFFQLFEGPAVYPKLINRGDVISFTFKLHFFIFYQFCSDRKKYCTLRLNLISTQFDDRGNVKLLLLLRIEIM